MCQGAAEVVDPLHGGQAVSPQRRVTRNGKAGRGSRPPTGPAVCGTHGGFRPPSRRQAARGHTVISTLAVEPQRRVDVLGGGTGGEPANLVQRRAPEDGARPDKEGGIPAVLGRLDDVVEHRLLAPQATTAQAPEKQTVGVVVGLGRLDERQLGIDKVAERPLQELGCRDMIRIEGGDELGIGVAQAVVQVACLGIAVRSARLVVDAQPVGHEPDLGPIPVVQHQDSVCTAYGPGAADGRFEDLQRLVIGWDQDVDRNSTNRLARKGYLDVAGYPKEQHCRECPVRLSQEGGQPIPHMPVDDQDAPTQVAERQRDIDGQEKGVVRRVGQADETPLDLAMGPSLVLGDWCSLPHLTPSPPNPTAHSRG